MLYYGFARWLPVSYLPGGRIAQKIRRAICSRLFGRCGQNVNVESGARFHSGRKVFIGDNSDIGEDARIMGSVVLGSNVMMGPSVLILSMNHEFSRTDIPMNQQGFRPDKTVHIGDDVWIGARAILLSGVSIGSGAIVGAGSVVTSDVPEWAIAAGNPARIVRYRNETKAKPQESMPVLQHHA